jgi:hypothetical protein
MKPGQGSRVRFGDFTIFVEAREQGWVTTIDDQSLKAWHWQETVASETHGRALALTKLLEHLTPEQRRAFAVADLRWETYGQT